ncbi:hypothetical protein BaRGS_00028563 [Batillaria attramentaria]|uniref:E3 ubiquitin-protein ligase listerin n=1 Tax=Batillaria attramentaria TaxID=370345 RepID=A0ABD0K035_9CAEN
MPGAKNRTKGNVKPSSSSQAARLLAESGAAPTGFVGFGGSSGMPAYVPASQAFDDVDSSLDADFRLVLRKLTKRDSTTKVKALGEFNSLCQEKDDATIQAVLPFWPRIYNKMAIDVDHRVRECTQNAMATLVGRVRRNLAPYLKNVMGAWLLSQNDTYPTVASAARKAFSAAFPDKKKESAVVFCKTVVAEYLVDNLLNQTPSTLSDPKTTPPEEMEAKYQRVLSSSLLALRQLLLTLPPAELEGVKGHMRGLLNDGKFWKLSKSAVLTVRSGMFWFTGSLCQAIPDVAQECVSKLSPLILGSIDSSEPGMIGAVWDAVLSLVRYLPDCWQHVNWQKAFWPKLRSLLESGCQGTALNVVPNLLPLLSCVPMETAGGAVAFLPRLLDHFKLGFTKEGVLNSVADTNAFARGYMECVQFAFKQIQEAEPTADSVLESLLMDQLLPVVEASLLEPKPSVSRSPLYGLMASFIASVEKNPSSSQFASMFWAGLSDNVTEQLESVTAGGERCLRIDRLVLLMKAILFSGDSSKQTGGAKPERVKFASEEASSVPRVPSLSVADLSSERRKFVEKVVVQSHRLYHEQQECVYLKLFADLANLYFPASLAAVVLQNVRAEAEEGAGERLCAATESVGKVTEDLGQMDVDVEKSGGAHSGVIQRVVLPMLGSTSGGQGNPETVDHIITLLFACLPHLSSQNSTDIWESVLQSATSANELCCLVERALDKRQVMPQVTDWLCSPYLTSRLRNLVTLVTTQHSNMPPGEVEQSWKVICLVLSANDDNEPVFSLVCIKEIISSIHSELVSLASRTMEPQDVQLAIQFVSRAALTFFQNLRMSLSLPAAQDLILALMLADLDTQCPIAGETASSVREAWSVGLGAVVSHTGGLLQDGGLLASGCTLIRETAQSKTHCLEDYRRLVQVTEHFVEVVKQSLPRDDDGDLASASDNPCVLALLPELLTRPAPPRETSKVLKYLCIDGQLPLTDLDSSTEVGETSSTITGVVFASLFNLWLLHFYHTDTASRDRASEGDLEGREETSAMLSTKEWSAENVAVLLDAVENLTLANTWLKTEAQVPEGVSTAVEELSRFIMTCTTLVPDKTQWKVVEGAITRAKEQGGTRALAMALLLGMLKDADGKIDLDETSVVDSHDTVQLVFRTQAAVLESIDTNALPLASSCLRVMAACLTCMPEMRVGEVAEEIQNSLADSQLSLAKPVPLQSFSVCACRLLAVAARTIQQCLPTHREAFPASLETEWKEFFCEGLFSSLLPLFVKLVGEVNASGETSESNLLLSAVGSALCQCPQELVVNHKLPPYLLASEDTSPLPDSLQTLLNRLCPLLTSALRPVQITAYTLLDRVISLLPAYEKDQKEEDSAQKEEVSRSPPVMLMKVIEDGAAAMDIVLSPVPIETTVAMAPGSEEYQFALGYLFAWQLMLSFFHSAHSQLRAEYAVFLKDSSSVVHLLNHLFRLMPHTPVSSLTPRKASFSTTSPLKSPGVGRSPSVVQSPFKFSQAESGEENCFAFSVTSLGVEETGNTEDIQRVACSVYRHCLAVIPALVRQWWKDQDRKTAAYVDKFTCKNISPLLCKSEFQTVQDSENIEGITVKARVATREVTASYQMEEVKIELQITLPENYPLGNISVSSERRVGVNQAQWDRWLLQLNVFLQHQNGSIMEGLQLWKNNIDKRFEGVEDCMICFAVVHGTNFQLPRLQCRTCKKKFHSACLYKWFNTSQNSTCPLCRNLF